MPRSAPAVGSDRMSAREIVALPRSHQGSDLHARAAALAGIGAWECDLRTETLTWTSVVFDLFGIAGGSRIDRRDIIGMYCEESRAELERLRSHAIEHRRGFSLEARIYRPDGEMRWMRLTAGTTTASGRSTHLYGTKQDITEERARWEALRRLAEQDALTGLSNRGQFQTRFLHAPAAAPIGPLGALLLFDVDGFKQVNDKWGHAAGDACLAKVAARLSAGFPDALMIARIGGDEFAVLTRAGPPRWSLDRAVRKQLMMLAEPMVWRDQLLDVSASAGVAPAGNPGAYDAEALFAAADAALYCAKRAGRSTYRTANSAAAA
ncbi:MAG: diguanylate cyclase [Sphingomonas bacterium]|jgi:diguanylate cyclase (GGDEF)-like protein/PAS domain S-box-containing protein|nr:diguanylate cyclase [Sphingomonas bacterium]MDB5716699.1 diguanylate cyclase [Sphingomonas bacterium]